MSLTTSVIYKVLKENFNVQSNIPTSFLTLGFIFLYYSVFFFISVDAETTMVVIKDIHIWLKSWSPFIYCTLVFITKELICTKNIVKKMSNIIRIFLAVFRFVKSKRKDFFLTYKYIFLSCPACCVFQIFFKP